MNRFLKAVFTNCSINICITVYSYITKYIKELTLNSSFLCRDSRQWHTGLLVDWLALLDPQVVSLCSQLQTQLLFNSSAPPKEEMEKKSSSEIVEGGEEGEISAMETSAEEVGTFVVLFYLFIIFYCLFKYRLVTSLLLQVYIII